MKIDFDYVSKSISITEMDHQQMDNLRILLQSIKNYSSVLDTVSDEDLSLTKLISQSSQL